MAILKFKDENNQWQDLAALRGRDGVIQYQAGNGIVIDGNVISAIQQDLSNYYTKAQVNDLIDAIDKVSLEPVNELPVTGEPNVIYLVPSTNPQTANAKDEYIYIDNAWEQIGTTAVDLSNYYTKSEVDNAIAANGKSYLFDLRKYYPTNNWGNPELPANQVTQININNSTDRANIARLLTDLRAGKVPNVFFKCYSYLDGNWGMNQQKELITPAAIMPYGSSSTSTSNYTQCSCFAIIPIGATTESIWPSVPTGLYVHLDLVRNRLQLSLYLDRTLATQAYVTELAGTLSDLTTTDKTNLVAAINEVATGAGGDCLVLEFKAPTGINHMGDNNYIYTSSDLTADQLAVITAIASNPTKKAILFKYTDNNNENYYETLLTYQSVGTSSNQDTYYFTGSRTDSDTCKLGHVVMNIYWNTQNNTLTSLSIATYTAVGTRGIPTLSDIHNSLSSYLSKTNTTSYTPTGNYHPATKKYVDDSIASAIPTGLEQRVIYIDISSTYTGVLSGDHTYQNITIPTEALAELNALDDISNALIIIHTAYDHVLLNPQSRGTLIDSSVTPKVYGNTYVGTAIRYGSVVPSSPTYTQCCLIIRYTKDPFTLTGTCDFRSKPQEIALKSELHTHSNKTVLDTITAGNVSDWNDSVTNSHTHANKTVLDGITAANVTTWNKTHIYSGTSTPGAGTGENGDIYVKYTA